MSRLLESLRKVEQQRPSDSSDSVSEKDRLVTRSVAEPSHFWTSVFWLVLLCGVIASAFVLLQ